MIRLEDKYPNEIIQLGNIIERYDDLVETDITESYKLAKDSLQVFNRFSTIKYDIKKQLLRGQESALKDRLKEICDYLISVNTHSRMIWSKATEARFNHNEGM